MLSPHLQGNFEPTLIYLFSLAGPVWCLPVPNKKEKVLKEKHNGCFFFHVFALKPEKKKTLESNLSKPLKTPTTKKIKNTKYYWEPSSQQFMRWLQMTNPYDVILLHTLGPFYKIIVAK